MVNIVGQKLAVAMFQIQVETDAQVPGSIPHLVLLYRSLRVRNNRAAPSVEAFHRVSGPNTGRNSGGRWIIIKNCGTKCEWLNGAIKFERQNHVWKV